MGRHEHPSAELRCGAVGCDRRAMTISEIDGRPLCHDCAAFEDGSTVRGSGFSAWVRRLVRRK